MSMNLYLHFIDKKGRSVNKVDLIQTSTNETLEILGYHPALSIRFNDRFERYLKCVEHHHGQEILEFEKRKIQEALDAYGDDYEPDWYMM